MEDEIHAVIPREETVTVIDNIGMPISGLNLALGDPSLISSADGEVLVQLSEKHHPTADYVKRLRRRFAKDLPSTELFFLARGNVSVNITLPSGDAKRLATFSPGMAFGEMAVIDGARRSAIVIADDEVECDLLHVEDFHKLTDTHPRIKIAILTNLGASICGKLRKANHELSVYDH